MTWPVTPLQSIHVDPTAANAAQLQFKAAMTALQEIFSQLPAEIITDLVNAILSSMGLSKFEGPFDQLIAQVNSSFDTIVKITLQNLGSITLLQSAFSTLQILIQTVATGLQSLVDNIANALGNAGVNFLISEVGTFLLSIPGALINGLTTIEQNIIDAICNALGHSGTGHTVADIETYLGAIPGANIVGTVAASIISGALTGATIAGSDITGSISAALISGTTVVEQAILDAVANALGHTGTGHTTADIQSYLGAIPGANLAGSVSAALISGVLDPGNIPALAISGITGLTGYLTNLTSGGLLSPSGLATGAIPTGVTLAGSQLTGAVSAALISGVLAAGNIPALAISGITGLSGYLTNLSTSGVLSGVSAVTGLSGYLTHLTSGGVLSLAGLATGAIPAGITLAGSQLTGAVSAALVSGVLSTGNIPALAISGITGLSGYLTHLTSGGVLALSGLASGALPSGVTAAITNITGLAGYLTNLSSSGLLSGVSAVTGLGGYLTHLDTSGVLSLAGLATGALPAGITLAGTQLTGSLDSALGVASTTIGAVATDASNAASDISTIISGVSGTVAADVSTAITTAQSDVQGVVNGVYNAVENTTTAVDQAVTTVETGLSGFFTNLYNNWTGSAAPSASASDVASAGTSSKTIADTHTVSIETINSVLPGFYGGGGAGNLNKSVSLSGTLPAGFTSVSTIAVASAMYNTPANTDSETVSGAWSVTDTHAQYLFLRANSSFTTYVYAKLQANDPFTSAGNCEIGCVVSGTRHVFTTFALPGSFISSANYSLAAVDFTFTVTGPGTLAESYTDSGTPISQKGSSYRYGGFGTDGYSREIDTWSAAGSTTYTSPAWMQSTDTFDCVGVGAGGGGAGGPVTGGGFVYSYGGAAGAWNAVTVTRAVAGASIAVDIQPGGLGGPVASPGTAGGATTIGSFLTAAGGAGGTVASNTSLPASYGASPGNETYHNAGYTGGAVQIDHSSAGNPPGGGGTGGPAISGSSLPGTDGAPGAAWITANDLSCPGSLGFWSFYDSVTSGPTTAYVATGESTTSASYTDLATTTDEVTVNIGSSGLAMVLISNESYTNAVNTRPLMGFALSGANTKAATIENSIGIAQAANTSSNSVSGIFLLSNLSAGATTFKAKYLAEGGVTGTWVFRTISVIPL